MGCINIEITKKLKKYQYINKTYVITKCYIGFSWNDKDVILNIMPMVNLIDTVSYIQYLSIKNNKGINRFFIRQEIIN